MRDVQVYKAYRVNVCGLDSMHKYVLPILFSDLLKLKRAFLIGRPDLMGKSRFSFVTGIMADFLCIRRCRRRAIL
ncbi:MAG: hypothetical protein ACTSWN_15390 [Promethearchaeota archaeon]